METVRLLYYVLSTGEQGCAVGDTAHAFGYRVQNLPIHRYQERQIPISDNAKYIEQQSSSHSRSLIHGIRTGHASADTKAVGLACLLYLALASNL